MAQLDVALRPTDDRWHVSHDEPGIATLVERLRTVQPTLVVLEATGGLEAPVIGALAAAGLPVVVVNPRHARVFAKATGRLAKTDTLDARGLAHVQEIATLIGVAPFNRDNGRSCSLRVLLQATGTRNRSHAGARGRLPIETMFVIVSHARHDQSTRGPQSGEECLD
jgi:transposase